MSEEDNILRAITRLMGITRRGRTIYDYERDNSRERIRRVRPWEKGRIGCVEQRIAHALPRDGRPISTGDLGRYVYEPIVKDKNAPPFKLSSWQYARIRRAAPTFADPVGRSETGSGRPHLWRLKYGELFFDTVRREKRKRCVGTLRQWLDLAAGV